MRTLLILAAGLVLVSAGCCAPRNRASMTVETAMQQVAEGLNAFSDLHVDKRSGLMPDEVIVVLNITEAQTTTGDAQAGVGVNIRIGGKRHHHHHHRNSHRRYRHSGLSTSTAAMKQV